MKRFFLIAMMLLILPLLFSCQHGEPLNSALWNQPFQAKTELTVNGYTVKGTLYFMDKNKIRFVHEDDGSPFHGMEEILDGEHITVRFMGITWEAEELYPTGVKILKNILSAGEMVPETTITKGDRRESFYRSEQISLTAIWEGKSKVPISLKGTTDGISFQIQLQEIKTSSAPVTLE